MGLAAAELRGHIEDGRGFGLLARQPADHLRSQAAQVLRQVGPLEELLRVLVDARRPAVAHLVQVDGELRSVQRLALAQVLAGVTTLYQGLRAIVCLALFVPPGADRVSAEKEVGIDRMFGSRCTVLYPFVSLGCNMRNCLGLGLLHRPVFWKRKVSSFASAAAFSSVSGATVSSYCPGILDRTVSSYPVTTRFC